MRKLKQYRQFAGITQAELGEIVGLAESTMSSYEQETGLWPKLDVAVKIRDEIQKRLPAMNISLDELFGLGPAGQSTKPE